MVGYELNSITLAHDVLEGDLNIKFFFSKTGSITKARELKLLYYLPTAGKEEKNSSLPQEHQ